MGSLNLLVALWCSFCLSMRDSFSLGYAKTRLLRALLGSKNLSSHRAVPVLDDQRHYICLLVEEVLRCSRIWPRLSSCTSSCFSYLGIALLSSCRLAAVSFASKGLGLETPWRRPRLLSWFFRRSRLTFECCFLWSPVSLISVRAPIFPCFLYERAECS